MVAFWPKSNKSGSLAECFTSACLFAATGPQLFEDLGPIIQNFVLFPSDIRHFRLKTFCTLSKIVGDKREPASALIDAASSIYFSAVVFAATI
jgi:hypothetical protein